MERVVADVDLAAVVDAPVAVGEARVAEVAAACRPCRSGSRSPMSPPGARTSVPARAAVVAGRRSRRRSACRNGSCPAGRCMYHPRNPDRPRTRDRRRRSSGGSVRSSVSHPLLQRFVVAVAEAAAARQLARAALAAPARARRLDVRARSATRGRRSAARRTSCRRSRSSGCRTARFLHSVPHCVEAVRAAAGALPADLARLAGVAAARRSSVRVVAGVDLAAVRVDVIAVGGERVARDRALCRRSTRTSRGATAAGAGRRCRTSHSGRRRGSCPSCRARRRSGRSPTEAGTGSRRTT